MKIILSVVLIFLFASCDKQHCWECTKVHKTGEQSKEVHCDMTKAQIRDLEDNWKIGNVVTSFDCKKK